MGHVTTTESNVIVPKAPLILAGQLYLNADLNEYLIVTSNNRGQVAYSGAGFSGQAEDVTFLERFQPVDPADVEYNELTRLLHLCQPGTVVLTGCTE